MKQIPKTIVLLAVFFLFILQARADVITVSDSVNHPIADNDVAPPPLVTLQATAPVGSVIDSVAVDLEISHPWIGDVVVMIRHEGLEATLIDRLAIGAFPFGCGGDNIDATFTDEAVAGPEGQCSATAVPTVSGDVLPATALSVFNGQDPNGSWEVFVADGALYDVGALDGVSISINFASPCPRDLNGDGLVGSADLAALLGSWGQAGVPADFDGNGVGSSDLAQILGSWGACS